MYNKYFSFLVKAIFIESGNLSLHLQHIHDKLFTVVGNGRRDQVKLIF